MKAYVCPLFSCGRMFKLEEQLKQHLHSQHTIERQFQCQRCKKRFASSEMLDHHARSHSR
ncbi:hypothetical protein BC835DRAFT_1292606, partial [Cytidiella melzeri]